MQSIEGPQSSSRQQATENITASHDARVGGGVVRHTPQQEMADVRDPFTVAVSEAGQSPSLGNRWNPISRNLLLDVPVRLLGAEISLLVKKLTDLQAFGELEYFPSAPIVSNGDSFVFVDVPIAPLCTHLDNVIDDIETYRSQDSSEANVNRVSEIIKELKMLATSLSRHQLSIDAFVEEAWRAYEELCALTVFRRLSPSCQDLKLSLLEFNTDFSGLPLPLISVIEEIDSGLLIDPSLKKSQEGFGRTMTEQECKTLLSSLGCRVFVLQSERKTVGYYMLLPHPQDSHFPGSGLLARLIEEGIISEENAGRIGFARSVAVKREGRLGFARAGINSADLLDDTMAQIALLEGCEILIATVRVGDNPNAAVKSHLRHGWRRTGIIVNGNLEIIIRNTNDSFDSDLPQNLDGEAPMLLPDSRYLPHGEDSDLRLSAADAPMIGLAFALGRSKAEAEKSFGNDVDVKIRYQNGCNELVFEASSGTLIIRQVRPDFDYWIMGADQCVGSLEECLEHISDYPIRSWNT